MNWRVTGLSVQGASHQRAKVVCQDAVAWACPGGKTLLAVVADGAGSARLAEVGATVASQAGLRALAARFGTPASFAKAEDHLRTAFGEARQAVLAEALKLKAEPRDFACTLLLLAANPDTACAIQIGDGAALAAGPDGLRCVTRPPEAEYLNETLFLTNDQAADQAQVAHVTGPIARVAMFTDGLQMLALKMPEARPHERFFAPLFDYIASERDAATRHAQFEKFLTSPRLVERADDDLTLLLAVLAVE